MKHYISMIVLLLSLLGVNTKCTGDDCSPNWLPFDNMNSALKGYDIMTGNPFSNGKDPGFRQQIFVPTVKNAEHRYELHSAFTYDNEVYCDTKMTTDISSTSKEYRKFMRETSKSGVDLQVGTETEVTAGIDIKGASISATKKIPEPFTRAWGKSNDFQSMQGLFSEKKSLVATSFAKCQLYEVIIHTFSSIPPLMEPFKKSIKELHQASGADKNTQLRIFKSFIRHYGTHFSIKTSFGGEIVHRTVFSSSTKKKFDGEKIKKCEYVRGSKIFGIQVEQDKEGCSSTDEKRLYNEQGSTIVSSIMSKGAPPEKDIYTWAQQDFKSVPLKYQLSPIINLFKKKYLDDGLQVSAEGIRKWFVPLYFNFCVSMYGSECSENNGCGYDDQCPSDTDCVGGPTESHYCRAWSSWSCQHCSKTAIRTRMCHGCSGKTTETKEMCQIESSCFPDKVMSYNTGSWGSWRSWEYCPKGTWVVKLQTNIESYQGGDDDTALNAISLRCNNDVGTTIKSGYTNWGTWRAESQKCINGFYGGMLKFESYQGSDDDTSTNAIRLICRDDNQWYKSGEGGWGSWTQSTYCPAGYKIVGLQTQIESYQGSDDDTSLNGVRLLCRYFG